MQSLQMLLEDQRGLDLITWSLEEDTGVSADGRTIGLRIGTVDTRDGLVGSGLEASSTWSRIHGG